ncbi:hypothetical protein [Streptomyces sp. IBSBF 2435]|uniref:hypothetical protein n=1 Tax=Streptomyces sp. IBSBF 2435 TaxID=2903531 RepID=UPI002FDBD135
MTDEQPKQSVQSAWVLRLRREAERLQCDDMARITFVGLLIATHTDAKGAGAFMAPATLAGISGYSEDMVRRCIAALVGIGLLLRQRRQGKTSVYQLLVPAGAGDLDWSPHLLPFEQARQAAARRRTRSAERSAANSSTPVATGVEDARRDGAPESRTPVASGNSEHPSRRGIQDPEHPSRRPENARRVGEPRMPVASGGYLDQSSTSGRDPETDQERAGLVAQPQVGAREAAQDESAPGLQALPGGGRGPAGDHQAPLLLSVHTGPPALPDLARIADRMTALYGVIIPRRFAAPVALDVLGDLGLDLPDPTAYVIAALDADPDRYRPTEPRAAGAS